MKIYLIPAIIVALAILAGIFSGGCASAATNLAIYQAIGTDKAAVDSTTALYKSGTITKADATTVYSGAVATETALKAWQASTALIGGGSSATTSTIVTQDITTLLNQIKAMSSRLPATAKVKLTRYSAPAPLKMGSSVDDVITLVEIAVQLAPGLEAWADSFFNTTTVTPAQITQAFADLDTSLTALSAALNPTTP